MERLLDRNIAGAVTLTELNTDTGVQFVYDQADDRAVFVATGSGTITVEPNGPQGVAAHKITVSGDVSVFTLDSYFFKGTDGKVTLKGESSIEVGVIALP